MIEKAQEIKRRKDFKPLTNIGKKYGHLTVLKLADTDKKESGCRILYKCLCDCGRHTLADRWALESGHKTKCEHCSKRSNNSAKPYNRNKQVNNTSGCKGVDFNSGYWRVRITLNNKTHIIGKYATVEEATAARKSAETLIKKIENING